MKKIRLPTGKTVSFTLPADALKNNLIIMPDGKQHIPLGSIGKNEWDSLERAKDNGGKIIWSTIYVEQQLEEIILLYFMGPFSGPEKRRELFKSDLLQASFLQFHAKKQILLKIAATSKRSVKGKMKDKLNKGLSSIMKWRNAFAHGSLTLDASNGVILTYYSGSQRKESLNNQFWETVESTFNSCSEMLEQLEETVRETYENSPSFL